MVSQKTSFFDKNQLYLNRLIKGLKYVFTY